MSLQDVLLSSSLSIMQIEQECKVKIQNVNMYYSCIIKNMYYRLVDLGIPGVCTKPACIFQRQTLI